MPAIPDLNVPGRRIGRAIALAGLVAGVLDITDALAFQALRGNSATAVLHYIASGVLGRETAYQGGAVTAALGLGLHFLIAFTAAAVFVLTSQRLPVLRRRPLLCGALYGLAVNAWMRSVILPLAGFQVAQAALTWPYINLLFAHVFCVGLPIALIARHCLDPAP
jgi:uncharacterized membrane protein YagU involved in acid resistance